MRFLIFLSNSGGHIMPGLTFGDYLKNKGEKVTYVASNQKTSKLLIKDECIWVDSNTICKESLKDLKNLQKIQLAILDSVSLLLHVNGELVYSTCSISMEENEDVVKKFLQTHSNFELKPFKLSKLESKTGMLKIMPDQDGNDGFFIAKFKLRG